ncbi:MAG: ABC transporter permease subunit [Bacteroidota bacterium]|nr:ABC transporter permease subunit [Bacteroidota bacterium]MDP4234144.1 ABC transporter permease subunit [Bacteroidota bacterium]MDP4244081.1 ABC transporter permease subunit [Bacteroidota bacterium]MDP4289235.1 ABC transporter permease subunit [Bacteroidota bacterium]
MSFVRDILSIPRRIGLADLVVFAALGGVLYWLILVSREWSSALQPHSVIHTEFAYLPIYTLYSLSRGLSAYVISLLFTIGYGYTMAHSPRLEKTMLAILDILQSVPVVSFLPELVVVGVYLFPHSYVGLEIASVLTVFTGQVWNMTFAFYHSLKAIPNDLRDASRSFYLSKREQLWKLELPASAIPLVWNSMMSMAGGWFFLSISEAIAFGGKDFKLPGIGSYMSAALSQGNVPAMIGAIVAMGVMILLLDRLLWRPLVIWSRKFRVEELSSEPEGKSFVLDILGRSAFVATMRTWVARRRAHAQEHTEQEFRATRQELDREAFEQKIEEESHVRKGLSLALVGVMGLLLAYGVFELFRVFTRDVTAHQWLVVVGDSGLTLLRTLAAVLLGAAWTIPVGVIIGMNPRYAQRMQPIVQFISSFPAPMFFPIFIFFFEAWGVSIEYGSIFLMLLGTQWYMLFNVIAGASAVPTDLQEMFASYRIPRKMWWWKLALPAIFPAIVTGAITAAGGAWNASIVSEFVQFKDKTYAAHGVGALLSIAYNKGQFALLGAGIFTLCLMVVLLNKFVWRRLYTLAQDRFALNV